VKHKSLKKVLQHVFFWDTVYICACDCRSMMKWRTMSAQQSTCYS